MMKINLGCGGDLRPGYINIDMFSLELALERARQCGRKVSLDRITYKNHDLNKYPYPFKDNSVDSILAFGVLEHIKDYESAFKEITRILKPGGILHIKVPHFTAAGNHSEFHKTRFWWHSFSPYRLKRKSRTSLEALDLYSSFITLNKKINFVKGYLFWNYLIEWLVNLNYTIPVIYEHTFLHSLFPSSEVEVVLKKK